MSGHSLSDRGVIAVLLCTNRIDDQSKISFNDDGTATRDTSYDKITVQMTRTSSYSNVSEAAWRDGGRTFSSRLSRPLLNQGSPIDCAL
jgi:hypothetical protein